MSLWRRVYSEKKGVALPILLFLAANVAILILLVWPLRQSVAGAADDAFDAMAGLDAARQMDTAARTAQSRMEGADVELNAFYADVLPTSLGEARNLLLFELPAVATSAGVVFNGSTSEYEPVRESRLVKVSTTATLRGQYQNILRFLHELETTEKFVVVESVQLAQSMVMQQSSGGVLELVVDVATYYLPPEGGTAPVAARVPTVASGGDQWP